MNLNDLIQAMLKAVKTQALMGALAPLATFFTNISKDTSALNLTLQLGLLNAQLLGALPGLEQTAAKSIADTLNAEIANLVAAQASKPAGT